MSISLSFSLSLTHLTWASEEASPANPRRAFALLQVTSEKTNQKLPHHQAKNNINNMDQMVQLIELDDTKWRQRAKQNWLQFGDKNSNFFHACVNQRRKKNRIHSIQDTDGELHTDQPAIEEAFLQYYQHLFQSNSCADVERCLSGMDSRITPEMNEELLKPCTLEEVSHTLQHMGPLKASGPDGFSASFYQHNWATIGDKVCHAIFNFLNSGIMDKDINATHIVLVTKKTKPLSVADTAPLAYVMSFTRSLLRSW